MKNLIWSELCNLKYKEFLIDFLIDKYQKRDRNINIFLAVISSGSIAAWTMLDNYPKIWSLIIVSSQVLTVIKPHIPYFKYIQELKIKNLEIKLLNSDFEKLWYEFKTNSIDNDKAKKIYFNFKTISTKILDFNDEVILNVNKKIKKKANSSMNVFLKTKYEIVNNPK